MAPKTSKPNTNQPAHIGRMELAQIEKLSPKEAVSAVMRHEIVRSSSELVFAAAADVIIDQSQKLTTKFVPEPIKTPLRVALELGEAKFEHEKADEQGAEHDENMKIVIAKTLGMYRQTLEDHKGDKNFDVKKIKRSIRKLQYLDAWYHNDVKRLEFMKDAWKPVAAAVNWLIRVADKQVVQRIKTAALEVGDWLPLACPESIMEVYRISQAKVVMDLFNEHPDVSKEEEVHFPVTLFKDMYELQRLRMKAMAKNFSLTGMAEAYAKQAPKTAKKWSTAQAAA